ncbi:MAG: DUF6662 family protein [bacterium]
MRNIIVILILMIFINSSLADDRRFTFTYESSTLAKNSKDIEVWTTYQGGRNYFYSRFDHRLEFEIGLTDKLQTAFYLNLRNTTSANSKTGKYETEFEWEGISSEWKYQAMNKYKDGIGLAPYIEFSFNTREAELETKLIIDKQFSKKFIAAFNMVAEYEWGFNPAPEKTAKELGLEFDLGLAYDITPKFSIGLESKQRTQFPDGKGIEYASIFLGPNVSYREDSWYFALTYLTQLPAFKRSVNLSDSQFVLDSQERNNARLIFGFTL